MMRFEGNKLVAIVLSAGMAATFLAACSINTDKLGEGISDLGNAFVTETETTETKATETTVTEETTAASETSEAPAETTPVATPTPSATPLPQRVDFSNLTDIQLNDTFTVSTEAFSESAYVDGTEVLLSKFEGCRFVVSRAANENVANSINLIVNGFYNEAAGVYNRVYSKAKAEYDLKGSIESPYNVLVAGRKRRNRRGLPRADRAGHAGALRFGEGAGLLRVWRRHREVHPEPHRRGGHRVLPRRGEPERHHRV